MPAKSFTLTLTADSTNNLFSLGSCTSTHIVAYNPTNTSQYAVYSGTSFTVYGSGSYELVRYPANATPSTQSITIDYDSSKWDFHGLASLEGAALCIATNASGSAPDGHDYASIASAKKNMFWYEVIVIRMVDKINSCDIYAKRAEQDKDGNDIVPIPSITGNGGKILAVNAGATATEWVTKPTTPTVDQTYNSASTNAQSGTAVAGALANIKQVPSSTSADEDKVLTVNSSGTPVWATAQGSSYTFSNPIKETSGTVSLDYDTDTLSASTTSWTQFDTFNSSASGDAKFRASQGYMIAEVLNFGGPWSTISLHIPGNTYYSQNYNSYRSYFISLSKDPYLATSADRTITYIGHPLATEEVTLYGDTRTAVAEQDVVINFTDLINTSLWTPKQFNFSDEIYLGIVIADTSTTSPANEPLVSVDDSATVPVKYSSTVAAPLTVKNPIPASTSADEGKVLTVGSSGLEWVNGGGALYLNYSSISLSTRADALALAEQIQGAIDANKAVVLKYSDTYANTFYLSLTKFNLDPTVGSESGVIQFMCGANVVTEPTGTHLYSYLWNVTITTSGFTDGRMSFFYGDVSAPTPIPT